MTIKLNTPIVDKFRALGLKLTVPIILMRYGGLDGVALQADEYSAMLEKCVDVNVHIITGRYEQLITSEAKVPLTIVDRLDFYHPDSVLLFGNQFTVGPETDGVEKISDEEWIKLFHKHKAAIKKELNKIIEATPYNSPIIVFNLLSLRHAHPAAAAALRELIEHYQNRAFLSHAADPDAERPEKISRIKPNLLKYISANPLDKEYSGGPYRIDNLYHIVLNPKQREKFLYRYQIPADHVFELPDFLEFSSNKPDIPAQPEPGFIDYLATKSVFADGDQYRYSKVPVDSESIFFLSPVRPVYRKRIKEAMLVAYYYGISRRKSVVFVITHPDGDDKPYFMETVRFANALGLQYIHLGEEFNLKKLTYVYRNFAALNSVGVVASAAGGWENALNEMAAACIPFFMNIALNSFKTLTERMGIKTYGMDFSGLHELFDDGLEIQLSGIDLSGIAYMQKLTEWIDLVTTPAERKKIVVHNFYQAYQFLSQEAAAKRLVTSVQLVYDRHKPSLDSLTTEGGRLLTGSKES